VREGKSAHEAMSGGARRIRDAERGGLARAAVIRDAGAQPTREARVGGAIYLLRRF